MIFLFFFLSAFLIPLVRSCKRVQSSAKRSVNLSFSDLALDAELVGVDMVLVVGVGPWVVSLYRPHPRPLHILYC